MKKYFPILKSKEGEFRALGNLSATVKNDIAPVIEVLHESYDMTLAKLREYWNFEGNEVLLDNSYSEEDIQELDILIANLSLAQVNVVPVLALNASDELIALVRTFCNNNDRKICIRINGDFARPRIFNPLVQTLIGNLNVTQNRVMLLFDLGYATDENHRNLANSAINNIRALQNNTNWNQIIVASGSFPPDLGQLAANRRHVLQRYEWDIWSEIQLDTDIKSLVYYGDFGIKHPIFDVTIQGFQATSSIKYTSDVSYVIYRGIVPSNHPLGNGQYHDHCRQLVADTVYDGAAFSHADNEISEIAGRNTRPGNAGTWVRIGQCRHISKIHTLL